MTGNDIVDLDFATYPCGNKRLRLLDKIFTRREQELLDCGVAGMWAIWAMKEATYKAHHRRFNLPRRFDPKIIEVKSFEPIKDVLNARAAYDGYDYWGKGLLTSEYIHFTASCFPGEFMFHEIHSVTVDIKTRLKDCVALKMIILSNDISMVKNVHSIPQLFYKKEQINLPFSISHHGRFNAFSFQLINY